LGKTGGISKEFGAQRGKALVQGWCQRGFKMGAAGEKLGEPGGLPLAQKRHARATQKLAR